MPRPHALLMCMGVWFGWSVNGVVTPGCCKCRQEVRKWRAEDIEQRVLNNAFLLWERYAESNRRFVEERAEQLKSFANLAALVAGFAIVSFLQVCLHSCTHWMPSELAPIPPCVTGKLTLLLHPDKAG